MLLIPRYTARFISSLSDDAICDAIYRNLERKQAARYKHWLINAPKHRVLEGSLHNYHFRMNRVVYAGELLHTEMRGRIRGHANNTSVELEITWSRSGKVVLFFLLIFLGLTVLATASVLISRDMKAVYLIPLLVLGTLYALMLWSFHRSLRKDLRVLEELFQARPENEG